MCCTNSHYIHIHSPAVYMKMTAQTGYSDLQSLVYSSPCKTCAQTAIVHLLESTVCSHVETAVNTVSKWQTRWSHLRVKMLTLCIQCVSRWCQQLIMAECHLPLHTGLNVHWGCCCWRNYQFPFTLHSFVWKHRTSLTLTDYLLLSATSISWQLVIIPLLVSSCGHLWHWNWKLAQSAASFPPEVNQWTTQGWGLHSHFMWLLQVAFSALTLLVGLGILPVCFSSALWVTAFIHSTKISNRFYFSQ